MRRRAHDCSSVSVGSYSAGFPSRTSTSTVPNGSFESSLRGRRRLPGGKKCRCGAELDWNRRFQISFELDDFLIWKPASDSAIKKVVVLEAKRKPTSDTKRHLSSGRPAESATRAVKERRRARRRERECGYYQRDKSRGAEAKPPGPRLTQTSLNAAGRFACTCCLPKSFSACDFVVVLRRGPDA